MADIKDTLRTGGVAPQMISNSPIEPKNTTLATARNRINPITANPNQAKKYRILMGCKQTIPYGERSRRNNQNRLRDI